MLLLLVALCSGRRPNAGRPRARQEKGAAAVEYAVILPVFLLMMLGAVDFGRGLWTKSTLSNAAREATRYASVRSTKSSDPATPEKVAARIVGYAGPLDPEAIQVSTSWQPNNSPGSMVQVDLTYTFEPVVPIFGLEQIELTSSSQMIVSY